VLSLAAPAWLTALLVIPAIWWLHRSGPRAPPVPVADLGLWSGATPPTRRAGERRQADPAWIRRALITAALAIALAEPVLLQPGRSVTLWIDDSLSMLAREGDHTRLATGMELARLALADADAAPVVVRTMSSPWRSWPDPGADTLRQIEHRAGSAEPRPPPDRLLSRASSHWLLTDGADAELNDWAGRAPIERVIQVGSAVGNAGVISLSARPALGNPHLVELQARVVNGGDHTELRRLELGMQDGSTQQRDLRLEPGASATIRQVLAVTGGQVEARLQPADALPEDDSLVLELKPLQTLPVFTDPACPSPVHDALRAHPGLEAAREPAKAGLVVACSKEVESPPAVAGIRFNLGAVSSGADGELLWSQRIADTAPLALDAAALPVAAPLSPPAAADEVLLERGDEPLVIRRHEPRGLIETSIDPGSPGLAARQEFPLLIALLVDEALDRSSLGPVAVIDRDDQAPQVVPARRAGSTPRASRELEPHASSLASPLLLMAAVLLLWELGALVVQYRGSLLAKS
jgi:hypothetical protein